MLKKLFPVLIALTLFVSACGEMSISASLHVTAATDVTLEADQMVIHSGKVCTTAPLVLTHYEMVNGIERQSVESFEAGTGITVTEPVTIVYSAKSITGRFLWDGNDAACAQYRQPKESVATATATTAATAAPTATGEPAASSQLDFVLAHGASFQDYITDNRDYRELGVDEIYAALIEYGYKDSDLLVIAHSDEVREWQEANRQSGSYDTGKALIKIEDILNLKSDKGFMIVSPNVYSAQFPGGPNITLEIFVP